MNYESIATIIYLIKDIIAMMIYYARNGIKQ